MSPTDEAIQRLCLENGFMTQGPPIIFAILSLVLGILIGYVGAKWRQMLEWFRKFLASAALKRELDAAKSSMESKDNEEEQEEDEDNVDEDDSLLAPFLSGDSVPGLDDHPEMYVNPIMLFEVKRRQEEKKMQKLIESLLAEQEAEGAFEQGYLTSLSTEERMALGRKLMRDRGGAVRHASVGSVEGFTRTHGANTNSMAILVHEGLRLAQANLAVDDNAKKSIELREHIKTIDKHLSAEHDIDVSRTLSLQKGTSSSLRIANALQKANATKHEPFSPANEVLRYEEILDFAQRGRKRVAPPLDQSGPTLNQRMMQSNMRRQSLTGMRLPGQRRASQALPPPGMNPALMLSGGGASTIESQLQQAGNQGPVYNRQDFTI
jgi:hypothetical protein